MEIELKYSIPDEAAAQSIWDNEMFKDAEEQDSREELMLDAQYFDTDDFNLADNRIAYRIRHEGSGYVATLKWKGHSVMGLHVREEVNVAVEDAKPAPEVFAESTVGKDVMAVLQDKPLHSIMRMKIKRRRFRLDTGTGIFEFSLDNGTIYTDGGEVPVNELEIELFSGEQEELLDIGSRVEKEYGLCPENTSKYVRGLRLIKSDE